ncbi:hypothetical protein [Nocardia sp. NPDC004260]
MLTKSGITADVRLTGNTRSISSSGSLEFHLKIPADVQERTSL